MTAVPKVGELGCLKGAASASTKVVSLAAVTVTKMDAELVTSLVEQLVSMKVQRWDNLMVVTTE